MSDIYARQIKTANRLLTKYGQACVWRKVSEIVPDASKPWLTEDDIPNYQEYPVNIAFFTINKDTFETLHAMGNTEVTAFSQQGYMPQVSFEPSLKDIVIVNGKELRLNTIDVIAPNGEKILYNLVFK